MATLEEESAEVAEYLLNEASYLPADLVHELALYRGKPDEPDEEAKCRLLAGCRQLQKSAEIIPDSLEGELYSFMEQLGEEMPTD